MVALARSVEHALAEMGWKMRGHGQLPLDQALGLDVSGPESMAVLTAISP